VSEADAGERAGSLRRFKPYPAYKDSGVEWLGEIPAHWEGVRLKTLASVQLSNVDKKSVEGQEPVRLCSYTDVYYGLGDRAGTCIDPKCQVVEGKTVCVVSCQRSPEPVFLKWKGLEIVPEGDFFVRSGPGTVRLAPDSAREYVRTRFPGLARPANPDGSPRGDV